MINPISNVAVLWGLPVFFIVKVLFRDLDEPDRLKEDLDLARLFVAPWASWVLGVLVVLSVVIGVFSLIGWRYRQYALDSAGFHTRDGYFIKTRQTIRWNRIQSVEVQQSLWGRLIGYGKINVDTASADEQTETQLMPLRTCAALRSQMLTWIKASKSAKLTQATPPASGEGTEPDSAHPGNAVEGAEPVPTSQPGASENPLIVTDADAMENDELFYHLQLPRLLRARLRSVGFYVSLLIGVAIIVFFLWRSNWIGAVIAIAGTVWGGIKSATVGLNSKIYIGESGLRVRTGIGSVKSVSLSPERIHRITLSQPMLWRGQGWWNVSVSILGKKENEDGLDSGTIMPVATREQVRALLEIIAPAIPPELREELLLSDPLSDGVRSPRTIRFFHPIGWKTDRYQLAGRHVVVKYGKFWVRSEIAPISRIQAVHVNRGPLDRQWGTATLHLRNASGVADTVISNFPVEQIVHDAWEIRARSGLR